MSGIGQIELVFLFLLLFIVVFGVLARRLGTPYPIVMVVGGLLVGLIPGIPPVTLNPDLVFLDLRRNLCRVGGLLTFAIVRFRRRKMDDGREPAQVYGSNRIEVACNVIPVSSSSC